ncbi:MAG: hypothetical protein NTU85_01140 [Candidatus Kaiserbacteria bacterium]|nr:hypothetical protein [Candidatus Kaiserbacteria bacterium]
MKYGELNLGQVEAIVNKLGGMEGVQRFLAGNSEVVVKKNAASDTFRLTVDHNKSLAEMIAAGRYDWTNDDITAKRFPITGEGLVEFEARYFHFDRNISSEDAVKKIEQTDKENPWMSAKIEHLLAFGEKFPEEQRKFPIVALGSVAGVRGDRGVPCLGRDGSRRGLGLHWWSNDWGSGCRFLAVRKVSVS